MPPRLVAPRKGQTRYPPHQFFLLLTLQSITITFSPINHPNLGQCGSGSEEIEPPDSRDDVGFSVSTIAGGLFLLPVATGETEKRAIDIGTIMSADQRLGVSAIWELASK